jgi:hypothetical protein
VRKHFNSNAAFGSRWFNTDRGAFLLWHRPRSWPSQGLVPSPPQRSRPSAFASPAISLPTAQTQRNPAAGHSRVTKLKPELPGYVVASQSIAAQGCQLFGRFWWPFQVVCLVRQGQGGCRGASAQILVAVGRVSRTFVQCKQETQRCLTPRSSGAPTSRRAGHQAQGLRPILRLLSSTPRCWLPRTSNVRHHFINVDDVPAAAADYRGHRYRK